MKNISFIIIITLVVFSCNNNKKESVIDKPAIEKSTIAASYKSLEVEIEGMTCEIGCARTIQSKLSKMDGVTFSKVNFETKKGQFTYDENKISKENIINKIDGIGGGDLYKVTKYTDFEEIIKEIE